LACLSCRLQFFILLGDFVWLHLDSESIAYHKGSCVEASRPVGLRPGLNLRRVVNQSNGCYELIL
jgi:hypothetical protein